jgi:hypothetical protein
VLVAGARVRDETPEVARVIEPPQMHQLVDQDVLAHRLGHQDEAPVETDVTGRRARSPARPLIPYADTRHLKAMVLGQAEQLRGQVASGLPAQLSHSLWSVGWTPRRAFLYPCFLTLNPGALLLGKQLGVAAGSPSRNGDADASVRTNPNEIPSCSRMTDEFHETIDIVLRHGS